MPSVLAVAGRWLLFLGLIGLLGAAAFGLLVATPATGLTSRFLPLAWLAAAAGTIGSWRRSSRTRELRPTRSPARRSARRSWNGPCRSSWRGWRRRRGRGARHRRRAALAPRRDRRRGCAPRGRASEPRGLRTGCRDRSRGAALHVLAVGLWLGGLAGLLLTLGRDPARDPHGPPGDSRAGHGRVSRSWQSRAAPGGLGDRHARRARDDRLRPARHRQDALLGVLALLGAANHFRNVPAAGTTLGGLRRVGSVELLVGATVVLLSAGLVNLAPPVEVAAAEAAHDRPPGRRRVRRSGRPRRR